VVTIVRLFEQLPRSATRKPKLVFFYFDEGACCSAREAPRVLLVSDIELVVRRCYLKGVGIYFVTQNPLDDSGDAGSGSWATGLQHALRFCTFTLPRDQKAVEQRRDVRAAWRGWTSKPSPGWPWARPHQPAGRGADTRHHQHVYVRCHQAARSAITRQGNARRSKDAGSYSVYEGRGP
jgi:hypothetical protein